MQFTGQNDYADRFGLAIFTVMPDYVDSEAMDYKVPLGKMIPGPLLFSLFDLTGDSRSTAAANSFQGRVTFRPRIYLTRKQEEWVRSQIMTLEKNARGTGAGTSSEGGGRH